MNFEQWMRACATRTEAALEQTLPSERVEPARLHRAMRYAVLQGGKRMRPLLVYAAGEAVGAAEAVLTQAAVAVECIHAYSLVHDDMPDMDNDTLRRGKPTVWVEFDAATALLVGDALQSLAFATVCQTGQLALVQELAEASGSLGMAGGQAIDLASVGQTLSRPELEHMHRLKTGALLRCSVRLGAWLGRALTHEEKMVFDQYANAMGLAFQVVDDVLDAEADTATLGKTAGKDAAADKPTYVSLLGLSESKALAQTLRHEALSALKKINGDTSRLANLADLIVLRQH